MIPNNFDRPQFKSQSPVIVFACAMPPPVNGQNVVNTAVRDALIAKSDRVIIADISSGSMIKNLHYHLTRLLRVCFAAWILIRSARAPRRKIYMVIQGGYGIFYNYFLLGLARILDYRIILHHHEAAHTKFYRRAAAILMALVGTGTVHAVLSPAMAEDLKRYKQVRRVIVSQNAGIIPDPSFLRPSREGNRPLVIGHMSNLSRAKGLNIAIDTVLEAKARGLNVKLILAGPCDGFEAETTLKEAQKKLGDALEYRGPVGGETKDKFFRDIDVFLFPTIYKYEAQPLVILEAMSYSAAVIVAERGYTAELVDKSGDVFAGDSEFPKQAADRLAQFLADGNELTRAQSMARSRYVMLRKIATEQFDQLIDLLVS